MMVSIRRMALICYTGALFLCTHIPLARRPHSAPDSWLETLFASAAAFGKGLMVGNRDKMIHFAAYTILTLLAFWAAASYPRIRDRLGRSILCTFGLIIVCSLLAWGMFDEATQPLFGRHFDWNDCAANAAGISTAACAIAAMVGLRSVSAKSPVVA